MSRLLNNRWIYNLVLYGMGFVTMIIYLVLVFLPWALVIAAGMLLARCWLGVSA